MMIIQNHHFNTTSTIYDLRKFSEHIQKALTYNLLYSFYSWFLATTRVHRSAAVVF